MLEKTRGTITNGRYRDTGYQTKNDTQHRKQAKIKNKQHGPH